MTWSARRFLNQIDAPHRFGSGQAKRSAASGERQGPCLVGWRSPRGLRGFLLGLGLAATALLPACSLTQEPINGCTLAAVNEREILRARNYLNPAVPAKILALHYVGAPLGHSALIFRADERWYAYDDAYGTRQLPFPGSTMPPPPLLVARAAFPGATIDEAHWY